MAKIIETLKSKNIAVGWHYAYIHFITEIISFYFLYKVLGDSMLTWLIPFIYDAFAFVPQGLIGKFCDEHPRINIDLIGIVLLALSIVMQFYFNTNVFVNLLIMCFGNCLMHVAGAECTLRTSGGKLTHPALFVAGGSFGVVTGRLLPNVFPVWFIALLSFTMIPFAYFARKHYTEDSFSKNACESYKYANVKMSPLLIIFVATFVVIVRGYMGYGIPTSWNQTTFQTILLFFTMGIGKALGGILSDSFGARKIAAISTVFAIPFLCIGDNMMVVSLIGVMLFSMTMAITLGILVSVLPKSPGLAFGYTTIGLFLGTAPIFFVKITSFALNIGIIIVMSLVCTFLLLKMLKKD